MKKNKKSAIIILPVLALVLVLAYIFQKPTTTDARKIDFRGSTIELSQLIQENASAWLGKTVQLTGKIQDLVADGVVLQPNFYCQWQNQTQEYETVVHQELTIKGQVIGYDELLEEIKLNQCIIID